MIEALESFRQGWANTDGMGSRPFASFFGHWEDFRAFAPIAEQFYRHVRCGILHQAEVTGGWRVRRKGPLIDTECKIINAARFLNSLRKVLGSYCDQLASEGWDSQTWEHLRAKMGAVCRNALNEHV